MVRASLELLDMRWTHTRDQHLYMQARLRENRERGLTKAEEWMLGHLKTTGLTWKPQHLYGCRIFDFWNDQKGIAVEVDGREHNAQYDDARDTHAYLKSGIQVFRVENFSEDFLPGILKAIRDECSWWERRASVGLGRNRRISKQERRHLLLTHGVGRAHTAWSPRDMVKDEDKWMWEKI